MKAILLHHAGGDKYAFRNMQEWLLPEINSIAFELPGRGDRYPEKLTDSIDGMLEDLLQQIKKEIREDYFFVGMSMGAVLAFLLTHKIRSLGLPLPKHLFLAARLPFQHYETRNGLEQLSSDDFWKFITEYDERSQVMIDHVELRELFEPIIRADFRAMQNFDTRFTDLPKLDVPASILYGEEDVKMFDRDKAEKWNDYFAATPEYIGFKGKHFFIYENPEGAGYIKKITSS